MFVIESHWDAKDLRSILKPAAAAVMSNVFMNERERATFYRFLLFTQTSMPARLINAVITIQAQHM